MIGVGITILLAFLVNLPLGRWRTKCRKFSPAWFLSVHLSIPFIILLRFHYHLGMIFVPFTIGSAVLGQFAGARKVLIVTKKRRLML